jgi:hypothetical protein
MNVVTWVVQIVPKVELQAGGGKKAKRLTKNPQPPFLKMGTMGCC